MIQILRKQNRMSLLRAFMPSVLLSFKCSSRASAWCLVFHMTRLDNICEMKDYNHDHPLSFLFVYLGL